MNLSDTQTCDTIDFIFECLWKDKDFLQQKYVIEGLSIAQILSSREAVRMGLVEHGIKRKREEVWAAELRKCLTVIADRKERWYPTLVNSE